MKGIDVQEKQTERQDPAAYPEGDDREPGEYCGYARDVMRERHDEMQLFRLQATQNMMHLAGLQWYEYDQRTGTFRLPNYPDWKQKPVTNLLVPYARFMLAKLTKNRPRMRCMPSSIDPDDIRSAALGDEILKAKWKELRLTRKLRQAIAWMVATGNAYTMTYWNTKSGNLQAIEAPVEGMWFDEGMNEMEYDVRNCPCDEEGEPKMTEDGMYDLDGMPAYVDMGEVGVRTLSPFQVFIDSDALDDDDIGDVIVAEALDIRVLHRRWPESKDADIELEDTTEITRFDNLIASVLAGADTHLAGHQIMQESDHKEARRVLVLHYFEKPCEKYPDGRHWVSAGRNYLLEEPGPLPNGIWPAVIHYKELEVPGQLLGDCAMTHAVGLQKQYNEIGAQIKEHHNLLLRGKWLVPRGSLILKGAITTEPGQIIQHSPGMKPDMQKLIPLPPEVYAEREKAKDDLEHITGAHQVSMGKPPQGVTAGRAFLTLQEADDSDLVPVTEMIEENTAQQGWQFLQLIQQNYEEERLVRFSGPNRPYQTRAFRGSDLSEIVAVEPTVGSAIPWSHTARSAWVLEIAKQFPELFLDPTTGILDQERLRLAFPVGGEEAIGHDADEDISKALREEELFEGWDADPVTGGMVLPVPQMWQNHAVHMRQHKRLLDSAKFEEWPIDNQEALISHYMAHQWAHEQYMLMQAQRMMMADAMSGPGTGSPAGPEGMPPDQGANLHKTESSQPAPGQGV